MFGPGHIAFIAISFALIVVGLGFLMRKRPTVEQLIKVCLPIAMVGEMIKLFYTIEIVPIVGAVIEYGQIAYQATGLYVPHLETEHLPLELCSLQMVFMFVALVVSNPVWKHRLYSIIYGTGLAGGLLAILLSSIAPEFETAAAFLTSLRAWEFFIYHAMLIVLALYIALDRGVDLRFRDIKWPYVTFLGLEFVSLYANSVLSVPVYQADELKGIAYEVNLLSSYHFGDGLTTASKTDSLLHLGFIVVSSIVALLLMYVPFLRRSRAKSDDNEVRA